MYLLSLTVILLNSSSISSHNVNVLPRCLNFCICLLQHVLGLQFFRLARSNVSRCHFEETIAIDVELDFDF